MKTGKFRLYLFLLCTVTLLLLLPGTASAEGVGYIGGPFINADITQDMTIGPGTFYVCSTADKKAPVIKPGVTLTIKEGSTVYFSSAIVKVNEGQDSLSGSIEVNGALNATGTTFKAMGDHEGSGWNGIQSFVSENGKAASVTLTGCIFQNAAFPIEAKENNALQDGQTVNVTATNCEFKDPHSPDGGNESAVYYHNGTHKAGTGSINLTGCTFTGYARGLWVGGNNRDAIDISVENCTFNGIRKRALFIESGRSAGVQGCVFNDVQGYSEGVVSIFTHATENNDAVQTVVLANNTFNGDATTNKYPVSVGSRCQINKGDIADNSTFGENYPAEYRYIQLTGSVGSLIGTYYRVENAIWGAMKIPYIMTTNLTIEADENSRSSLTINPGVMLSLGDGEGADDLYVRGDFTAEGTADKPITITKRVDLAAGVYGSQLYLETTLRGNVSLKYCVLDGLYRGLYARQSNFGGLISFENCTIQNTKEHMHVAVKNVSFKSCKISGKGILVENTADSFKLEDCLVSCTGDNDNLGVAIVAAKSAALKNCLITGFGDYGVLIKHNRYETVDSGAPVIENCTISGNKYGIRCHTESRNEYYGPIVRNSIVSGNTDLDFVGNVYTDNQQVDYPVQIKAGSVSYSLITNDGSALDFDQNHFYNHPDLGKIKKILPSAYSNRIEGDPLFAGGGDYHLKSAAGRWNGTAWVEDAVTSPCIDAGDPASTYTNEPAPNGERINLGRYGNTAQASKSPGGGQPPAATYTVTVSANPAAGGTVGGGGTYNAGSSVTVTATANAGYNFVRWTEGGAQVSTDASFTFTAEANRNLVAVFDAASSPPYNPPPSSESKPQTPTAPVTELGSGESMNTDNVERLVSDKESLTVEGESGAKAIFDTESLEGIGEQAGESISVNIADVSDEHKETHPGKTVFSLTVKSGDNNITNFGGSVTVYLPYKLKAGETAENVRVWHLTESGETVPILCTYDPVTGLVKFTVRHFSLYMVGVASPWENPFIDVGESDWFYDAVRFVNEYGLMVGTGGTTFRPQSDTSRAMIVTILHRLEGLPGASAAAPFADVAAGKWYADAVVWAAEKGIVRGYGDGRFGPEDAITREQMAVILMNYAGFKGYDVSKGAELSKYTDEGSISNWAKSAMSRANAAGLVRGDGAKLMPAGNAERCQVAAILQRFIENVVGGSR